MPTDDGYPTEDELIRIEKWPYSDPAGWFAFIKTCWWEADWGWSEADAEDDITGEKLRLYDISTGGWSGNESIISAMAKSDCWTFFWQSSRRGGHYVFSHPIGS